MNPFSDLPRGNDDGMVRLEAGLRSSPSALSLLKLTVDKEKV
jgi:hypothetical protein